MFVIPVSSAVQRRGPRIFVAVPPYSASAAPKADGVRRPALDVVEAETGYTATLEMPGIAREQFDVSIEGRRVDVSTKAAPQAEGNSPSRRAPRYARSFVLPAELEAGAAQASLVNGVLTLTLPKRAANCRASVTAQ